MPETPLEPLVQSLLFEGYALYPYTPHATKNATPTPFGIVYPPAYAAGNPHTHALLRMACLLEAERDAQLTGDVRFLQGSGADHQAIPRRLELGPVALGAKVTRDFAFDPLRGRVALRSQPAGDGRWLVRLCVHNETPVDAGADRRTALGHALISTHVVATTSAGRFISPLEGGVSSVNTFPVLATEDDAAVLGAAIVLPDHPQLAPESLGDLFDGSEIEEALMLHVHTLSAGERDSIAAGDPAIKAMLDRALAATPQDIMALHGRTTLGAAAGEPSVERDGVTYEPGMQVVLRPGTDGDPYDRLLDGRTATVQRIYVDYDDRVHLGLTVDDDPVQQLMRDTGRYLYFFPHEVEPA